MQAISLSWPLTIEQLTALDPLYIPIIGALLVLLVGTGMKRAEKACKNICGIITTIFIFLTLGSLLIYVLPMVQTYGVIVVYYSTFAPPLGTCLEIDMLSWFMMLVFTSLAFLVAIYSISYMKEQSGLHEEEHHKLFTELTVNCLEGLPIKLHLTTKMLQHSLQKMKHYLGVQVQVQELDY